jgi:hypothetical protein
MKPILLCLLFFHFAIFSFAGKISGLITDEKGNPLPYASISIKGTNKGTTANSSGRYAISLIPGPYTFVAQYVGYAKVEKSVAVTNDDQSVDFTLVIQQLVLPEVIVKKGEDPAYEIIRNAIKKRNYYNGQVDSFSVNVYIKGLMRSGAIPKKVFGREIEREPNDGLE